MRLCIKTTTRLAHAMAVVDTPCAILALTTLLSAGTAIAIGGPQCFLDQVPIPNACDRMTLPGGECPPRIVTNPVCGFVNPSTDGSTEFTTYDQRSCVYQPQSKAGLFDPCIDSGSPVTTNFSCTAESGEVCDNDPE